MRTADLRALLLARYPHDRDVAEVCARLDDALLVLEREYGHPVTEEEERREAVIASLRQRRGA